MYLKKPLPHKHMFTNKLTQTQIPLPQKYIHTPTRVNLHMYTQRHVQRQGWTFRGSATTRDSPSQATVACVWSRWKRLLRWLIMCMFVCLSVWVFGYVSVWICVCLNICLTVFCVCLYTCVVCVYLIVCLCDKVPSLHY